MKNNCAKPDFCNDNFVVAEPKLEVKSDSGNWENMKQGKVTFGSNKLPQAQWVVQISNKNGEEAHQAGFTVYFPRMIKVSDYSITGNTMTEEERKYFECKEEVTVKYNKVTCKVGNPIRKDIEETVTFLLDIIYVRDVQRPTLEGRIETFSHKTTYQSENKESDNELHRGTRGPDVSFFSLLVKLLFVCSETVTNLKIRH